MFENSFHHKSSIWLQFFQKFIIFVFKFLNFGSWFPAVPLLDRHCTAATAAPCRCCRTTTLWLCPNRASPDPTASLAQFARLSPQPVAPPTYFLVGWTLWPSPISLAFTYKLVYNLVRCCGISKYLFTWIHMSIRCSESERGSASSSPWVLLCGRTIGVGQRWKWTIAVGGGMMAWCSAREEAKWRRGWVIKRVTNVEMIFFIAVEGRNWAVWGGWLAAVVWIQCFGFGSRGETVEQSVAKRWSGDSKLAMGRKRDMTLRNDDIGRRRGATREGKGRRRC
jgi:hypothetical protein